MTTPMPPTPPTPNVPAASDTPRHPKGRYGRLPRIPGRPFIQLSRSLTGVVPAHPVAEDYLASHPGWLMLGNGPDPSNAAAGVPPDGCGDCVAVWWANNRRFLTATLTPTEVYPDLSQVVTVYKTQNPGFPNQDQGMVIQLLLEWLVKNEAPDGSQALGFASVDHKNQQEVDAALAIFGSLCCGIDVLAVNENEFDEQLPWDYVSGSTDLGGHCILTGGYGPETDEPQLAGDVKFITWAEETSFTPKFWNKEVDELWAVIYPEHLQDDAFMAGVNLAQFAADYTAITGKPFPAEVPPSPTPSPTPPTPSADSADVTFFNATVDWAAEHHHGTNKTAADARDIWAEAKGLS